MLKKLLLSVFLFLPVSCYQRSESFDSSLSTSKIYFIGNFMLSTLENPTILKTVDLSKTPPKITSQQFDYTIFKSASFEDKFLGLLDSENKTFILIENKDKTLSFSYYNLPGAYTDFKFTLDGKKIVLFYKAGVSSGSLELLKNTGSFAFIDTSKVPGDDNPVVKTVDLKTLEVSSVFFSNEFSVKSHKGQLMGIVSESRLTFINIANLSSPEVSVPLVPNDTNVIIVPWGFSFLQDPNQQFIDLFFAGTKSKDIYQLRFSYSESGGDGAEFFPILNQFTVGSTPSVIYPFYDNNKTVRIFSLNSSKKQVNILLPDSGNIISYNMPYAYNKAIYFKSEDDIHFLLSGNGYLSIADFDLNKADAKSSSTFTVKKLDAQVQKLVPIENSNKFLIFFSNLSMAVFNSTTGKSTKYGDTGSILEYEIVDGLVYFLSSKSSNLFFLQFNPEQGQSLQWKLQLDFGYNQFNINAKLHHVFFFAPGMSDEYSNFANIGVLTSLDYSKADSVEHVLLGFNIDNLL